MRRDSAWWLGVAGSLVLAAVGHWQAVGEGLGLRGGAPWWAGALLGLGLVAWWGDRGLAVGRARRWGLVDVAAGLSVVGAAALFRLWRITVYPPADAFGFEEFQTGGLAYGIARDWWAVPLEFPLANLAPGISFRLFGFSAAALRLLFVLSGILAPLFLFLALRRVVALPAAWAAAMLLAVNRWAAAAARFADEIFFPVSVVALAVWLFARAVQERRQRDVLLLALVTGVLLYEYSGYRVLPLLAFGGAAWLACGERRHGRGARGDKRLFALAGAAWAVLLSPGVALNSAVFLEAWRRHADAWGGGVSWREHAATGLRRLVLGVAVFVQTGDEIATVNIPSEPMFDAVTAAVVAAALISALWHWRDRGRRLALTLLLVPFVALALIPANFNVSRYFVLLVPMLFLTGYLFDDVVRWAGRQTRWATGALMVLVGAVGVINLHDLQHLIDSPVVQASFVNIENTAVAAIHRVPPGATVVLMTMEGSNALEPSDYRWLTGHLRGGRPESLPVALAPDRATPGPVYWVTQGRPEAELLPRLIGVACPAVQAKIEYAENPVAAVGTAWVESSAGCAMPAASGLRAKYTTEAAGGHGRSWEQTDAALMAYTVPWKVVWALQDRELDRLTVRWAGHVLPPVPGPYVFRVEVTGASATLQVGGTVVQVTAPSPRWESAEARVDLASEPVPIGVQLTAPAGDTPRIRLYWTPPGGREHLVPPDRLVPEVGTAPALTAGD